MQGPQEQLFQEIIEELRTGLAWNPTRPVVAMFGSARLAQDHPASEAAYQLAARLGQRGWTVLTGGGPGIMEAGNHGAASVKGDSVGLNIVLPHEQGNNPYQTVSLTFRHFSARKAVFVRRTDVFVAFEGGFGTLDEIFDTITQIQTGKRPFTRLVLVGRSFWSPLIDWIRSSLVPRGLIAAEDVDLFQVVETVEEAEAAVLAAWAVQNPNEERYKSVA